MIDGQIQEKRVMIELKSDSWEDQAAIRMNIQMAKTQVVIPWVR